MDKQFHIDIQNLKKHAEFYALKKELENFCDKMDSIRDFVPEVTYGFLITDEGKEILEKIKKNPPI